MAIINALDVKTVLGVAAIGLIVVIGSVLVRWSIQSRRPKDFPPGPQTAPILGNLTNIPTTKSFLKQVLCPYKCFLFELTDYYAQIPRMGEAIWIYHGFQAWASEHGCPQRLQTCSRVGDLLGTQRLRRLTN